MCEEHAGIAIQFCGTMIAYMAISHMKDHPKDGGGCARQIIGQVASLVRVEAMEKFEQMLGWADLENPFDTPESETPKTTNEMTMRDIMNMLKNEGG